MTKIVVIGHSYDRQDSASWSTCSIVMGDGSFCEMPRAGGSPLSLCELHLALAYQFCADKLADARARQEHERYLAHVEQTQQLARQAREQADLEEEPGSLVYYIRFGHHVKIGFTCNLRDRLASLPYEELLALERGGRRRETLRHAQFAEYRVTGEWFQFSDELRDHVEHLPKMFTFGLFGTGGS